MQLSMKCSIAVHCLIFIYEAKGIARVTSSLLSESTGCNPVIIRNIISALKKAGIITVARGTGGAELCKDPSQITLLMIYEALEPNGLSSLIGIHSCSERACPIAKSIQSILTPQYNKIEDSIRKCMENITLESMIIDFQNIEKYRS